MYVLRKKMILTKQAKWFSNLSNGHQAFASNWIADLTEHKTGEKSRQIRQTSQYARLRQIETEHFAHEFGCSCDQEVQSPQITKVQQCERNEWQWCHQT